MVSHSKNNVETEEDLRVVLKFINDLMDEEPFTLDDAGIEGVHYEIDDEGVYVRLDDEVATRSTTIFSFVSSIRISNSFPFKQPICQLSQ